MTYVVGGVPMDLPFMPGGGTTKTTAALRPLLRADAPVGAFELGSVIPTPHTGNEGVVQWPEDYETFQRFGGGANSYGMPGEGYKAAAKALRRLTPAKPVLVNTAAFSIPDYVLGVRTFDRIDAVAGHVINGSCPNRQDEKPLPIAYDLDDKRRLLDAIGATNPKKPVWFKEAPFVTMEQAMALAARLSSDDYLVDVSKTPTVTEDFLERSLSVVADYSFVRAVIKANTLGNVVIRNRRTGMTVTDPFGGQAGLSGECMREIVLDLVRRARACLPNTVDVIHAGGVSTGEHIVEALQNGAAGVQITSAVNWPGNLLQQFAGFLENEALQNYLTTEMLG